MIKSTLILLFIFCLPSLANCQKDSSQAYVKIATCFNQIIPNYSNFNFRFSDPNSGVKVNDAFHLKPQLNYYGIETDIAELVKPNGMVISILHLLAAIGQTTNNATAAYIELGTPGIGYELKFRKLFKRHNKYDLGIGKASSFKAYSRIN